jgi:hypothetical protein
VRQSRLTTTFNLGYLGDGFAKADAPAKPFSGKICRNALASG